MSSFRNIKITCPACNTEGAYTVWDSVGYTLKTLAAGLWAYWNAKSFEDGLLSVVRAGGDADTNAAVACAILGAKYGFSSIPDEYVNGLIYKEQLEEVVNGMIGLAK